MSLGKEMQRFDRELSLELIVPHYPTYQLIL